MKILHIVAGAWKGTGGPAEVIPNLCKALHEQGHKVTLLTVNGEHTDAVLDAEKAGVELISFPSTSFKFCRYSKGTYSYLKKNISSFDIVHNHGHWLYQNWLAYLLCKKFCKPLITTLHGTLVPGMLKYARIKKIISWNVLDKRIINQSSVIHCLSKEEAELTKVKIGYENSKKIEIIPNAADKLSFYNADNKVNNLTLKEDATVKFKTLLYMSRVSEIKGIADLLTVWQEMNLQDWKLQIVGAWDDDLLSLHEKAKTLTNVQVLGPIYGSQRFVNLTEADAFILPSYGEGLPTALLEASAARKVVLCSKECNYNLLEESHAGIVFNAGVVGIKVALKKLVDMSEEDKKAISSKAYELALNHFSWKGIATQWEEIYLKVLKNNEYICSDINL